MSQGVPYKFRNKTKQKPIKDDDVMDTNIIQHHFVICTVKYTHQHHFVICTVKYTHICALGTGFKL
jgi:hypothetical protein